MEESNKNGKIDYIPEVVDIEGLQGVNSSQGMEQIMKGNYPIHGGDQMDKMKPYYGGDNMYGANPMDGMHGPPMDPHGYGGGYYDGTCAQVMSCMANLCYMMSVYLTQMLHNGCGTYGPDMYGPDMYGPDMHGPGMCQPTMMESDDMNTGDEFHGYPPIY